LALGGLLLSCLVVAAIRFSRQRGGTRQLVMWGLVAAVLVGGTGARQYAVNTWTTGNPLYPMSVSVAGVQVLRGSPYEQQLAEDKGPSGRGLDLFQIRQTFNYFPDWRIPTSAGPKFLLLAVLALATLARPRAAGVPALVVGMAFVSLAAAYIPTEGFEALSRRFWPGSVPRFFAAPFALLTVAGLSVATRLAPSVQTVVRAMIAMFIVWDVLEADTSISGTWPLRFGVLACVGLLVYTIVASSNPARRIPRAALVVAGAVGLAASAWALDVTRGESRWRHYRSSTDVHGIPRDFVDGWAYLDGLRQPSVVALTAGWAHAGQQMFFYPLAGSRLQHRVTYVPLRADAPPGSPDFVLRRDGRFDDWYAALRAEPVDLVFVQSPWPIEDGWMAERTGQFELVRQGEEFRVYAVR
jgi:hypothetical protein